MAGFKYHHNIAGLPVLPLETIIIANSVTVYRGGWVRIIVSGNPTAGSQYTGGGVVCEDVAAAEATLYGVCEGFVTKDGESLKTADPSKYDGTYTAGGLGVESYVSASDNLTDKQVCALVRPARSSDVWASTPDAAIGTTAGSYTRCNYTDLVDSITVDENNAGNALTTVAQLMIWGKNPDDSTQGLYIAKELQVENG